MKRLLPLLLLFTLSASAQAPRLIVRGDDMGYTHSGNLALIKAYREGFEKSVEVIVPSPWFPEAVALLKENPGLDVGVHLALTSEWDNIKWRPLTDCKSLQDSNGYFFPMVSPNKNYPGRSILENKWQLSDIEKEFRAQIEMAQRLIPNISHISSHMWCTEIAPEVKALTKRLAIEYHIDIDLADLNVKSVRYDGPSTTPSEKIKSFTSMLAKLEAGKTYLFLDHPGLDDEELRAVHHIGYENVAADRQGVTDLFTSEVVREFIRAKGIQVISYKEAKNQ